MVVALAVIMLMSMLGTALYVWSAEQGQVTANSSLSKLALQAAQAGITDYQSHGNANPAYPVSFCSDGAGAPAGATAPSWKCTQGADPHNSAFVDWFNQLPAGSTAPTPSCSSSTQCDGWAEMDAGSAQSSGYQYVVDSAGVQGTIGGTAYLYVLGRAGKPGRYTCTELASSFTVQGGPTRPP